MTLLNYEVLNVIGTVLHSSAVTCVALLEAIVITYMMLVPWRQQSVSVRHNVIPQTSFVYVCVCSEVFLRRGVVKGVHFLLSLLLGFLG